LGLIHEGGVTEHVYFFQLFGRLAQAVKKHMPQCFVADLWTKQAELGLDDLSVAYVRPEFHVVKTLLTSV
jgi:hypothetical protein